MADITKCVNDKCKIKNQCYRYTAPDSDYQSYALLNQKVKDKKRL